MNFRSDKPQADDLTAAPGAYVPPGRRRTAFGGGAYRGRPVAPDVASAGLFPSLTNAPTRQERESTLTGFSTMAAEDSEDTDAPPTPPPQKDSIGMVWLPCSRGARPEPRSPTKRDYRMAARRHLRREQERRDEEVEAIGPHSRWWGTERLSARLEDPEVIEPWMVDRSGNLLIDELPAAHENEHPY